MKKSMDYDRSPGLARALFEESGSAHFLIDSTSNQILDANAAAQRMCGISLRDLLGKEVSSLFRADMRERLGVLALPSRITSLPFSERGYQLRTFQHGVWLPVDVTVIRLAVKPKTMVLLTLREAVGEVNELGEPECHSPESNSACGGSANPYAHADRPSTSMTLEEPFKSPMRPRS